MPLSESWFVCVNSFNTSASYMKQCDNHLATLITTRLRSGTVYKMAGILQNASGNPRCNC